MRQRVTVDHLAHRPRTWGPNHLILQDTKPYHPKDLQLLNRLALVQRVVDAVKAEAGDQSTASSTLFPNGVGERHSRQKRARAVADFYAPGRDVKAAPNGVGH